MHFWCLFGSFSHAFWLHFATLSGLKFTLISEVCFCLLFVDFDLNFGSILASETTPGRSQTRKARHSILNDSTMKIQLFDPVVVAGGSHIRSRNVLENVALFTLKN